MEPDGGDIVTLAVALCPATNVAGLILTTPTDISCGLMDKLRLATPVAGTVSESVTFTVKVDVWATVGVPEITPVDGASDSPAGSSPLDRLHV